MIFEKVQEVIAEQLSIGKEDIKLESRIKEDLDADSLDAVEIAIAIEDALGKEIPDDAVVNFSTVGDIVNFIDGVM